MMETGLLHPIISDILVLVMAGLGIITFINKFFPQVTWKLLGKNARLYGPTLGLVAVTCFGMWISAGIISQELGFEHPIKFDYNVLVAADNYSALAYVDAIGIAITLTIIGPLCALVTYLDYRKLVLQKQIKF